MDTHDVSNDARYVELMQKHQQTLRRAQYQKGKRPDHNKSRDEVLLEYRFQLSMKLGMPADLYQLQTSFIPLAYPPSTGQLYELTKVMIKELVLDTHHRGIYVILRSVAPPDRMTAVMTIVEDENADVLLLSLYHQDLESRTAAADILGEGRILLIKEPYLKVLSDGSYGIRVDHLSDVIHLPWHDERVPERWQPRIIEEDVPAAEWKTQGNDHFNAKQYDAAIECYTHAFDCSPTTEESDVLLLNRSLAFLRTDRYDAALADADAAATRGPTEKALYRKAQALYAVTRYHDCCTVLKEHRLDYPDNIQAGNLHARATRRLSEQENGRYSFKQMYTVCKKTRPPHLDIATYIGLVSIRPSGSRGRGLFTIKAVKAGDVLFCEKAFAHAFIGAGDKTNENRAVLVDVNTNRVTMGGQAGLIRMIAQKLYRNPSLASTITDLHHGTYKPVDVDQIDGMPVVDTFLIERIISLNSFGCPLTSRAQHMHTHAAGMTLEQMRREEPFHSCGIWPMASYINHCCHGTGRRSFVGDMMIVRATKDLAADTEITFEYREPWSSTYQDRQKIFQHWGIKCVCNICQDDATTAKSVLNRRKHLEDQLLRRMKASEPTANKIGSLLTEMANTYRRPATDVPG